MNKLKRFMCFSLVLMFLLSIIPVQSIFASIPNTYPTTLYIDAARIGSADSFLLSKNGDFMLVDTGKYEDSGDILNLLTQRNVNKLKALVITHYDSDHIGSYLYVIDQMKAKKDTTKQETIEHIYGRKYTSDQLKILDIDRYFNYVKFINGILRYLGRSSEEFNLDALKSNRDSVSEVAVATKANNLFGSGNGLWVFPTRTNTICNFALDGTSAQIQWLNRWESYLTSGDTGDTLAKNTNNDSLIFKVTYSGKSMLFVGDAAGSALSDLITNCLSTINCDILKISHHAHKGSSPKSFISAVSPTYSLATTTLDSLDEPDYTYTSRLKGLVANGANYGDIYYTGDVLNDFCTIAIRSATQNPVIYLSDTSLTKFTY
jgi:beta-lactamase superfamily II metal-dependent hydrolase